MPKELNFVEIAGNPITALILALLLGAAALSGKLSVTGMRVCLFLLWLVLLIPFIGKEWPIRVGFALLFSGALWLSAVWFTPDSIPGYTGILAPKAKLLFWAKDKIQRRIQIGDSATDFVYVGEPDNGENPPAAGSPASIMPLLNSSLLKVETIDGHVAVSARIYDVSGDLVAELIRNEWKVAPPPKTFDRNYTDDALEVRNPQGRIILQVKALQDRIQLQGEWWNPSGIGVRIMKDPHPRGPQYTGMMVFLRPKSDLNESPIIPMFKYPSETHFGELAP